MAIKMLVFDYRESEKEFFGTHELENFEITFYSNSLNDETVVELSEDILNNTHVISVFVNSQVSKNVINSFKNLRIISTRSTGVDHINESAANEKNITIINVEGYGAKSVAQYTFGLILALERHIFPASFYVSGDERVCTNFVGRDLSMLTLGVVGIGNIGAAVCRLAKFFGMKVIAYDIVEKHEAENNYDITYVGLNTLLKESDIITLHIPYNKENFHMFASEQFEMMKSSAYLINTSRSEIVCMHDLYDAVNNGIISGAALDIIICEDANYKCSQLSKTLDKPLDCLEEVQTIRGLTKLPNVIITPHIAYETQDAIDYILDFTFIAITECIKGGNPYNVY